MPALLIFFVAFTVRLIHIWQLRFLSRITGDPYFWQMANTIASDSPARKRVPGKPVIQKPPPSMGAGRARGSGAR